ncbi:MULTISPECIES: sugar ABC transporter ATP-binding protein [Providencia]|uniref:sugar ABC transporter ATP-binding protein n=1 Tax=Providencia rettgeri TaxID=587 RepID=UPI000F4789F1|nr:sugar ABC transporter ATP-binding protein [Providencia rettgeri]MCG5380146.1 sugar ABC transporter ATP-binding protein [Providencia rettgeri]MCX9095441.1 sugar ABC transporter ATP-binding protein [Providencia rettgeri]
MMQLLALKDVSKTFPGVKALDNINLSLEKGEVHALLGENGAGKSTLMKVLCGIHKPDSGQILIEGKEHTFHNYRDAIKAGVGIIFQEFSLIPYLNAFENIFLNRELKNKFGLLDRKLMRKKSQEILAELGVNINIDEPISHLSIAEQQFVEIAKALSLDAKILVLDEPTATLTPNEANHLFDVMRDLKAKGVGMFFISHHLEEIYEICDTISVLRDGQYIGSRKVDETDLDVIIEMMVGREVENIYPHKRQFNEQEVILDAEIQRFSYSPTNHLQLKKGEILGLAGLVGSGRTETILAMIGADKVYKKKVILEGKEVKVKSAAAALQLGIGLLPESRKTQGLVLPFSVKENIWLNNHAQKLFLIQNKKELTLSIDLISQVKVKTPEPHTAVSTLSGGNQQKVVIARWLNKQAKILIFDEPTRGIDVGAKSEIYQLMRSLTEKGISIIMISSELPEVIGVSDRVLVFRDGEIAAELTGDEINSTQIMVHAAGNII